MKTSQDSGQGANLDQKIKVIRNSQEVHALLITHLEDSLKHKLLDIFKNNF